MSKLRTVDNLLVNADVFTARFACDLAGCRGACCTMPGGRGAPLEPSEVRLVEGAVEAASAWLSEGKREIIRSRGSVEGQRGDYATRCVEDQDCVFVYYEGKDGVAKCAIERAWIEGKSDFRKPLSCHLFPIRVDELFAGARLRYEEIEECEPGRLRGERENIDLIRFLEEPLRRAFGDETYERLLAELTADD